MTFVASWHKTTVVIAWICVVLVLVGCNRGERNEREEADRSPPASAQPAVQEPAGDRITAEPTLASFERRAMLASIANNVIMPAHDNLVANATNLAVQVRDFANNPTVETLTAVQEEWRLTTLAWKHVEPFGFRRLMVLHRQIGGWPARVETLEAILAGDDTIDAELMPRLP